jgi:hypothetical protein
MSGQKTKRRNADDADTARMKRIRQKIDFNQSCLLILSFIRGL